jgi:hypothetical protein
MTQHTHTHTQQHGKALGSNRFMHKFNQAIAEYDPDLNLTVLLLYCLAILAYCGPEDADGDYNANEDDDVDDDNDDEY